MKTDPEETYLPLTSKNTGKLMLFLICGYLFLYIERPWEVWPWLAPFRIERVYMLFVLAVFAIHRGKEIRWGAHPFWVAAFLTLHYGLAPFAFSPIAALEQGFEYLKIAVLYFLMIWGVKSEWGLQKLVQAYVAITGLYMLHSFREYLMGRHVFRMGIDRMIGVDQFANDPNSFAASLVFSLPFLFVVFRIEKNAAMRWIWLACGGLAITCIVLTGSRAGFVTLILFILLYQLRKKGKRRFLGLVAILLFGIACWQFIIPEEKKLRFETIWDPDVGPANAEVSAQGRIEGLKVGLRMMADRPLIGAGAGNFVLYRTAKLDGAPYQAHNLAGELLGTMGLLGGCVFLCQIIVTWRMAGKTILLTSQPGIISGTFIPALSVACRQDLILLLCSGLFGHDLYRANWLWLGAWSFLCLQFTKKLADVSAHGEQVDYPGSPLAPEQAKPLEETKS